MIWFELAVCIIVICFSAVLLFGAPYVPTLKPQVEIALKLADLKPGQTLLELGCGDGKVLVAAARQGLQAVGYELNPLLCAVAWLRTLRYRRQVKVVWGDFWRKPWPPAEGIFTFLLPKSMDKLDKKVVQYGKKPLKLVSFAFQIPGKRPQTEQGGVYLYLYE
jgi:hypothetical protein